MLIYVEVVNELNGGLDVEVYNQVNCICMCVYVILFFGMNQDEFCLVVLEECVCELVYEVDCCYDFFCWGIYLDVMNVIDMDEYNVIKCCLE